MQKTYQIISFPNNQALAQAATVAILDRAEQAIAQTGQFKIVLAGGSTPNLIYQMLSQVDADWDKWWIFWGDERCLPVDDSERNSLMAQQAWLDNVAIPTAQIFPIPAEQGAEEGAENYEKIVANYLPFDMVLLGMGEDGHTASLFPGQIHNENELTHAVYNSPKPPSERVSISAKALSDTTQLLFLISGAGKLEAFKAWQQGADLPVAQIKPKNGIEIYADYAALGEVI
jgi:6-phosphogluconolactonase